MFDTPTKTTSMCAKNSFFVHRSRRWVVTFDKNVEFFLLEICAAQKISLA